MEFNVHAKHIHEHPDQEVHPGKGNEPTKLMYKEM